MGGEVLDVDVADFPRLGRRMVRRGQDIEIYDVSDAQAFGRPGGGPGGRGHLGRFRLGGAPRRPLIKNEHSSFGDTPPSPQRVRCFYDIE